MKMSFTLIVCSIAVSFASAADMITAREATNIAEYVVSTSTNAARGVDGAARMLPEYLHYAEFDDSYAADAEAWYEKFKVQGSKFKVQGFGLNGGCSVLRRGNLVGRNFDWPLDEAAEFVVRVSCSSSRHGSVGIATLGTNLTERMVTSGRHTDLYSVLPGRTVDGINDAGLVAEVNVIPYDPASSPTQSVTRTLHAFGVVRYALDNFGSAREAAEYVAAHYYIPEGSEYAYHWSFSDAEGSWIVEDGKCALATPQQTMSMSMTNFRIWWIARFLDPETGRIDRAALAAEDPYGTGVERFEAMYGTEDVAAALEAVCYTKTYLAATEPRRISEFAESGVARVDESAALSNVAARVIAAWPGREAARKQGVWWQTVHSSIYDIEKRALSVAVQEDFGKRYVFQVAPSIDPVVSRTDLDSISVLSHAITTYLPPDSPPPTVAMVPTRTRNYRVFIPNEATLRAGLPFKVVTDAASEALGIAWTNEIERLPAMVTVSEPMPGTLFGSVEVFDTGFDWSPSVVSATYDGTLLRVTGERLH
ncbi:MAG: hypothetical protein KBT68_12230, partial [bacterium]|nr:hypothetical protein [Candidatus Colisoma equi]